MPVEVGGSSATAGRVATADEQQVWLDDAMKQVQQHAFFMKRALDDEKLTDALKHASNMLNELRTSLFSPRNYYQLYMRVMDELRYLESYFYDDYFVRKRQSMERLYETVQHAGNIVPRLYLLVTVGSCYIKSKQAPAKDILKDLSEMCRGVQHPTRGLFLRNYLLSLCKDKLPDVSTFEDPDLPEGNGTIHDSINFILENFHEMSKLWIRLDRQASNKPREAREQERMELRMLVGTNLIRLSQLEGVDLDVYKKDVLPKLLDKVLACNDRIAQQYFMECIIQVFPDEFHLSTLDRFLKATLKLNSGVSLKSIYIDLMDRLTAYYKSLHATGDSSSGSSSSSSILHSDDMRNMFRVFATYINRAVGTHPASFDLPATIRVLTSLLSLAVTCYPDQYAYVNEVLATAARHIRRALANGTANTLSNGANNNNNNNAAAAAVVAGATADVAALDLGEEFAAEGADADVSNTSTDFVIEPNAIKLVMAMLAMPLQLYTSLQVVLLHLPSYPALTTYLAYNDRKKVAMDVCRAVLEAQFLLSNPDLVASFFNIIDPLLRDMTDAEKRYAGFASAAASSANGGFTYRTASGSSGLESEDDEDFAEEQVMVARMVNLIASPESTDLQFKLYRGARKAFGQGGVRRAYHTVVPIVFGALRLAFRVFDTAQRQQQSGDAASPAPEITLAPEVEAELARLFKFSLESLSKLSNEYPDMCFRVYLHGATVANRCQLDEIAEDFFTQAINCFESGISNSHAQTIALTTLISTLSSTIRMNGELYLKLARNACKLGRTLMKKSDQGRAALQCSFLFAAGGGVRCAVADGSTTADDVVMMLQQCLVQSRKLCEKDLTGNPNGVLVELLNTMLQHRVIARTRPDQQWLAGAVDTTQVNELVTLIQDRLAKMHEDEDGETESAPSKGGRGASGGVVASKNVPKDPVFFENTLSWAQQQSSA